MKDPEYLPYDKVPSPVLVSNQQEVTMVDVEDEGMLSEDSSSEDEAMERQPIPPEHVRLTEGGAGLLYGLGVISMVVSVLCTTRCSVTCWCCGMYAACGELRYTVICMVVLECLCAQDSWQCDRLGESCGCF